MPVISGVQYNALALPMHYTLGNTPNTTVSQIFWGPDATPQAPSTGVFGPYGSLKSQQWQQPNAGAWLVNRSLAYDAAGNVASIGDATQSPTETIAYTYDDLDRLLSASAPSGENYTYDQLGNITSKNGAAFTYGNPLHKHAVTAFGSTNYVYDANGSLTSRGNGQSITYDPLRRPVRVDSSSTLFRVAYDGDGARRKRLDANGVIHYLGGYERNVGTGQNTTETITKYSQALGRLIAYRKNGTLYWVGTDLISIPWNGPD